MLWLVLTSWWLCENSLVIDNSANLEGQTRGDKAPHYVLTGNYHRLTPFYTAVQPHTHRHIYIHEGSGTVAAREWQADIWQQRIHHTDCCCCWCWRPRQLWLWWGEQMLSGNDSDQSGIVAAPIASRCTPSSSCGRSQEHHGNARNTMETRAETHIISTYIPFIDTNIFL